MNKQEFLNMTELEQVEFINGEMVSKTTKIIAEEIEGMSQTALIKQLKSMGYKCKNRQYVKREEIAKEESRIDNNFCNDLGIEGEDLKRAILWAVEKSKESKGIIEIDTKYISNEKPKSRTFLVSEQVLKMWDEFCKENIIYQNQHLLTMALLEYIKNHS